MPEKRERPRKRRRRFAPIESLTEGAVRSDAVNSPTEGATRSDTVNNPTTTSATTATDDHATKSPRSNGQQTDTNPGKPTRTTVQDDPADTKKRNGVDDVSTTWPACRSVSHFERLNFVDEGTFGRVFRAREIATGKIYALKEMKEFRDRDGTARTTLREIDALFSLSHPNIVSLKEVVVGDNGTLYMVLEYAAHDILSILKRMRRPYSASEVKTLILQLLRGIAHMHSNWFVHRDIKPANLLLTTEGILKICDFGLARRIADMDIDSASVAEERNKRARTPGVASLWYRAPEILLIDKHYGAAIDMWAVGCVFAEIVRCKPLLEGTGEMDQLRLICEMLGPPSEQVWNGFSKLKNANLIAFPYEKKNPISKVMRHPDGAHYLSDAGVELLESMLCYDSKKRITAEDAIKHRYFSESPPPKDPGLIQTFPDDRRG